MDQLQALIAKHEGLRLRPYRDSVGKLTIGYGHNLDDVPISKIVADIMLKEDVAIAANECRQFPWFDNLDDVRTAVVVNMVFNLGINRFKKFKKTINYLKESNFDKASVEMMNSRWSVQVGNRADELSQMMKTGEFQ